MEEQSELEKLLTEMSDVASEDIEKGAIWWMTKTQRLHTLTRPYIKALFIAEQRLAIKELEIKEEAKNKGEKLTNSDLDRLSKATKKWVDIQNTKAMLKWVESQVNIAKKRAGLEAEERNFNQY